MIKALKEYSDTVTTPSWKWLRKYWKGYLVFLGLCAGVGVVVGFWDDICYNIQNWYAKIFKRKES